MVCLAKVNVQTLHLSKAAVGRFKQFSDNSGVVYDPFSGGVLALPEEAAFLVNCLCRESLSEGDLLSRFASVHSDQSMNAVKVHFDELLCLLIEEHGLVSLSAV